MSKRKSSNYFTKLQLKMVEEGVDQEALASIIEKSLPYVSARFNNKQPWSQADQYKIMDELNIPYTEMHEHFPKNGMWYKETKYSKHDYERAFLKLMQKALFEG